MAWTSLRRSKTGASPRDRPGVAHDLRHPLSGHSARRSSLGEYAPTTALLCWPTVPPTSASSAQLTIAGRSFGAHTAGGHAVPGA